MVSYTKRGLYIVVFTDNELPVGESQKVSKKKEVSLSFVVRRSVLCSFNTKKNVHGRKMSHFATFAMTLRTVPCTGTSYVRILPRSTFLPAMRFFSFGWRERRNVPFVGFIICMKY